MKLLCATNGDCSLYFWNAGFQLDDLPVVIGYIFANFSLVSVYETDLQDHIASEISSGLQKFIVKGTLVNIEYVLQSNSKLLAYNSNMQKVSQACKYFLMQHHANHIDDLVTIKLMNCKIGDENLKVLISCLTEQNQNLYFDVFDISRCDLSNSSLKTILQTLEHCLIKHLNVMTNNTIPNKALCDAILAKINVESIFLNFKNKTPLIILNDFFDESTPKGSSLFTNVFLVNCEMNRSLLHSIINFKDTSILYNIFLINNTFKDEEIICELLQLCKNSFTTIHIFQSNLQDSTVQTLADSLNDGNNSNHTFVLTGNTKLMAFRANEVQITEGLRHCASTVNYVQIRNRGIQISVLCTFFSESNTNVWDTIDLSGSSIKNEGLKTICECFSLKKCRIHIKQLDIGYSCLTLESAITFIELLQICSIKKLVISPVPINIKAFNESLSSYFDKLVNFELKIPMSIHSAVSNSSTPGFDYVAIYVPSGSSTIGNNLDYFTISTELFCDIFAMKTKFDVVFSVENNVSKSKIRINYYKSGIIDDVVLEIIFTMIRNKTSINVLDMSKSNIKDDDCELLYESLFGKSSQLKHIKELNISNNPLTSAFLDIFNKLLISCSVGKLIISNENMYMKIKDIMISYYFAEKLIPNFSTGISLMVINNTKGLAVTEVELQELEMTATVYVSNYKLINNLDELLCALSESNCLIQEIICFNFLTSNRLDDIVSFLHSNPFCAVGVFDNSEDDLTKIIIPIQLYPNRIRCLLLSSTQVFVFRVAHHHIIKALQLCNPECVFTVEITDCDIPEDVIYEIGDYMSNKFKALRKLHVCKCGLNENHFQTLSNSVFSSRSVISYIKLLNISDNGLFYLKEITKALQYCVIEKLDISNNFINNDSVIEGILTEIYTGLKIQNLLNGIPLIILNNVQGLRKSPQAVSTAFLKLDEIKESDISNLIYQLTDCKIRVCFVDMISNVNDLSNIYYQLPDNVNFVLYETNLTDQQITDFSVFIKKEKEKCFQYVMVSDKRDITNLHCDQLVTTVLANNLSIGQLLISQCSNLEHRFKDTVMWCISRRWNTLDLSGCNLGDKGCKVLCEWWSYYKGENYFEVLNLSDTQLTTASVVSIIGALNYGVLKKLIISNNTWTGYDFTRHMVAEFDNDKEILNFKLGVPLVVIGTNLRKRNPQFKMYSSVHRIEQHLLCDIYTISLALIDEEFESLFDSNVQLFNIYFTNRIFHRLENSFAVLYTNQDIILHVIQDSFILSEKAVNVITKLTRLNYPGNSNQINKIDISSCLIGYKLCTTTCQSFFSGEHLHYIKELDCSGNVLTVSCLHPLIKSLEFCHFEMIKISSSGYVFNKLYLKTTYLISIMEFH